MPDPTPPAPVNPEATSAVTEAEINARIEKARKEEKEKLYGELQALQAKLETSNQTVAQLQAIQTKLETAEAQIAALSKARTSNGEVDIKALLLEAQATVEGKLSKQLSDMQAKLDAKDAEARRMRLDSLKRELIADAKGRIIVAMVVGDTEEALRASAEESKRQYEAIVASNSAPGSTVVPPPPVSPNSNGGNPPVAGIDGFKRTNDSKKFGQTREQLMAGMKERYG